MHMIMTTDNNLVKSKKTIDIQTDKLSWKQYYLAHTSR